MSALQFSRFSKIPPAPNTATHTLGAVGYTCHMAVLHWAFMAKGFSQVVANRKVGILNRRTCLACLGKDKDHQSLAAAKYGPFFCSSAERIPSRTHLFSMVEVGDVLITGSPLRPPHSMVVRQKRGADHVTIRGYNNFGTLGTGVANHYDPVSHNITKDKYWANPETGKFGNYGVDLFVISYNAFMSRIDICEGFFCTR